MVTTVMVTTVMVTTVMVTTVMVDKYSNGDYKTKQIKHSFKLQFQVSCE